MMDNTQDIARLLMRVGQQSGNPFNARVNPRTSSIGISKPVSPRPPQVQQMQAPQQFTKPRVHAQTPDGASARWMELFRQ